MKPKIIGVTVGTPTPRANLKQTDPRKADYVKGKDIIPEKVSQLENDAGYLTEHQDISGKLDASKLPEAIDNALAQAKASGEFDGENGGYYTPDVKTFYRRFHLSFTPSKEGMKEVPTAAIEVPPGERGGLIHIYTGALADLSPGSLVDDNGNTINYIARIRYEDIVAQSQLGYLIVGDLILRSDGFLYPIVYIDPAAYYVCIGNGENIRGPSGANGYTPIIGTNGNWIIGYLDTGKPSRGEPGESVTITKITESTESGGSNIVEFSDGSILNVKNGKDGEGGSGGGTAGEDGEDGGYYTPTVTQPNANTMRVVFSPSKPDMPSVAAKDIALPSGSPGADGDDGVSPTLSVSKSGKVTTITIKDANGTKTAQINDGNDGAPGADGDPGQNGEDGVGISTIKQTTTSAADGGSNVFTVTLTNGQTATFTVKNGSKGSQGNPGKDGSPGADGSDGYTPARGTDYWTDADKAEIKSYVDEAILGGAW